MYDRQISLCIRFFNRRIGRNAFSYICIVIFQQRECPARNRGAFLIISLVCCCISRINRLIFSLQFTGMPGTVFWRHLYSYSSENSCPSFESAYMHLHFLFPRGALKHTLGHIKCSMHRFSDGLRMFSSRIWYIVPDKYIIGTAPLRFANPIIIIRRIMRLFIGSSLRNFR